MVVGAGGNPEPPQPTTSTSSSGDAARGVQQAPLLESQQLRSATFGAFTVASAALGVAALVAPGLLLSVALPGVQASSLHEPFVRIAGATMAASAAVEYGIKDAVDNNRLTSLTYQRLMAGVMVKSTGYLVAFASASSVWNPVLALTYPTLAAASVATSATVLSQVRRSMAESTSNNGTGSGSWSELLPKLPSSAPGTVYFVFAALYLATAAGCYGPEAAQWVVAPPSAAATDATAFLKATWAPGFALAGVACFVLADAADRGRLSGGTFRRLNLGLAVTEAAYTGVLLPAVLSGAAVGGAVGWSNLVGSLGITLYCAYQYVATQKK